MSTLFSIKIEQKIKTNIIGINPCAFGTNGNDKSCMKKNGKKSAAEDTKYTEFFLFFLCVLCDLCGKKKENKNEIINIRKNLNHLHVHLYD